MPDSEGLVLDGPKAAYDAAAETILNMMYGRAEDRDFSGWVIEIKDETGQTLLTVPFSEVARVSGSGQA